MIISIATMYQSPFDNTYANVPDFFSLSTYNKVSFGRSLEAWLDGGKKKTIYPTAKSFTPNDREVIYATIKTIETLDYQSYNYCILQCKPDNDTINSRRYFYFIEDIVLINSLKEATLKITLSKDIWATYIDELSKNPFQQNILRRHVPISYFENEIDYLIYSNENQVDKEVETTKEILLPSTSSPYRDDIDILWIRYKLNPTVEFFYYEEEVAERLESSYSQNYGQFQYLFYPLMAYQGTKRILNLHVKDKNGVVRIYDFGEAHKIPLPETDNVISVDLTFYPPFTRTEENYDPSNDTFSTTINWEFRSIYMGTDASQFFMGAFCSTTGTYRREYERIYRFDETYPTSLVYNYDIASTAWTRDLALNYYPYKKFIIRLPDGSKIPIVSTTLPKSLRIALVPTDTSIQYTFEVYDMNDRLIISEEATRNFAESTGSIPFAIDAYSQYLLTSAIKYDTNYQYRLDKQEVNFSRHQAQEVLNLFGQAITPRAEDLAGRQQQGVGILGSVSSIGHAAWDNAIETNYIRDSKSAMIESLKHTIGNSPSPSSDLSDWVFQDRIIIYVEKFIPYDHVYTDFTEFLYFGYNSPIRTSPLVNCRDAYDYVKTDETTFFSQIKNPTHRAVLNSIFMNGVRKWHIDLIPFTSKLNKNVLNFTKEE